MKLLPEEIFQTMLIGISGDFIRVYSNVFSEMLNILRIVFSYTAVLKTVDLGVDAGGHKRSNVIDNIETSYIASRTPISRLLTWITGGSGDVIGPGHDGTRQLLPTMVGVYDGQVPSIVFKELYIRLVQETSGGQYAGYDGKVWTWAVEKIKLVLVQINKEGGYSYLHPLCLEYTTNTVMAVLNTLISLHAKVATCLPAKSVGALSRAGGRL